MKIVVEHIKLNLALDNKNARRLFHGRGHCFDDLEYINVDWYCPVILITLYREPDENAWCDFVTALEVFKTNVYSDKVQCIQVQRRYRSRKSEQAIGMETLWGVLPAPMLAIENGLKFQLNLQAHQNIGFFLDMAPGRRWLQERARGKRVLNLFSYTCSFSVAAIAGGADSVVNIDMSGSALEVGKINHQLNDQLPENYDSRNSHIEFWPYNIFRSWRNLIRKGPYDLIVIDPPSRQKGSFVAEKDYVKIVKLLPELMPKGGDILSVLNAPYLGDNFISDMFAAVLPEAQFIERLQHRDDLPEKDPQRNLKMLHYTIE